MIQELFADSLFAHVIIKTGCDFPQAKSFVDLNLLGLCRFWAPFQSDHILRLFGDLSFGHLFENRKGLITLQLRHAFNHQAIGGALLNRSITI